MLKNVGKVRCDFKLSVQALDIINRQKGNCLHRSVFFAREAERRRQLPEFPATPCFGRVDLRSF